ncbi:MAG: TonB-dependent receptor [Polyangiaceae bacterium]|nr:TonB-dependent receptor [Polyangiaceae bacterium]
MLSAASARARLLLGAAAVASALARPAQAEEPIEIEVRGEPAGPPASSRDPTAASTVLDREELSAPGASAARVLARVPGVQVTESGSSSALATASVRGASSAQLPVYLAGIRLNDDVTGTADLSQVPLWMLERVEVFRGNGPEALDRLGIAGALVLEPRLPRRSELRAGANVGSFGELGAWAGAAVAGDGAASLFALRRAVARDDFSYLDDGGTRFDASDDAWVRRDNADHASTDAWAIGRVALGRGAQVTTVLDAFHRAQGVPGLGVVPARAARARVERLLAGVSARAPCPGARAGAPVDDCQLELASSAITARSLTDDPRFELGLGAPWAASAGERFVNRFSIIDHPGERLRWSAGAGLELERLAIARGGAPGLAARRLGLRLDASAEYAVSAPLTLFALGALERHATAASADEASPALEPVGRVGARVRVARGLELLGNLARTVRVPTLGELYGVSPLVRGNGALVPERAVGGELGFRAAASSGALLGAWVEGFGFVREVRELVTYRRAALGYLRPYNTGRARVLGAELALGADALQHLRADAAVTILDPRDTTPGRALVSDLVPYQARLVATAGLAVYVKHLASLELRATHRASRVADPAGLIVLAPETLLDLGATVWCWQDRVAVRGAIDDVTDAARFDVVGYPLPARSFHGSVELVF